MLVIVPNSLRDAINAKLDAALAEVPDAALDRQAFYEQLVAYFNVYGTIPEFTIGQRDPAVIGSLK